MRLIANAGGLHELGFAARIVCRDRRPFDLADVLLGAAMSWPKGKTRSPETRAKIGAANRGKTPSPEARAKMAAAKRGKTHSPETREKMAAAKRGKTHSPETREKISAAQRGKTPSAETRAKIAAAKRGKTNIPELRCATDAQRADFKLFRAKGYSRQEAIALAMGATA